MSKFNVILLGSLLLSFTGISASADLGQDSFPFVIPWTDAAKGVATDVSFLNAKPAGSGGFIVVKDGHFVQSHTGQRIRFLGTNFAFLSDYPDHQDASIVAAHLAKLGINIVRIHHEDANWGPLWDTSSPGHTKIDADALDKLDYLIAQLKQNGIYVDLNLHVSRQFVATDGFPPSVESIAGNYDKGIDNIDPTMISLQKKYASDYLTHVNPYTGLSYASDPAVAIVEINNENSVVSTFGDDPNAATSLPEPFRGELVTLWNTWLNKKYNTWDKLSGSWYPTSTAQAAQPADLFSRQTVWQLQDQTGQATFIKASSGTSSLAPNLTVTVPAASPVVWHTQEIISGINLLEGGVYTLTFRAKADKVRTLPILASLDQDDWHNVGLDVAPTLTTDWQTFTYTFQANNVTANHTRLFFPLGGDTGTVWLENVELTPITAATLAGYQAAYGSRAIDLPNGGVKQELADWHHFLADTEAIYADTMRDYLRNSLHIHANIIDTQAGFGQLSSFNREAGSDFVDNHAYWQHPSFPDKPWDSVDWTIPNTPMTDSLQSGGGGTLFGLAAYRVARKPYTITEYNHPAPSDYRSEMFPEISSFAAAQDWDGVFEFDYGSYGTAYDSADPTNNQKIQGFFSLAGDPDKEAFLPSAALMFEGGELDPLATVATLHLPVDKQFMTGTAEDEWKSTNSGAVPDLLGQRLATTVDKRFPKSLVELYQSTGPADTTISVAQTTSGSEYLAVSDRAVAAAGYVGNQTVTLGQTSFQFPAFGNNFASLTLVTLDQKPINVSKKLLLTIVGKAENVGMGWNATRTSVGDQWGKAPVNAEGIPATVTINTNSPKNVWALDTTGARLHESPAKYANGQLTFLIGPEFSTVWYEISD